MLYLHTIHYVFISDNLIVIRNGIAFHFLLFLRAEEITVKESF